MKPQSSYQARLADIAKLQIENEDLRRDIYSLLGENGGWVGRASAEAKWKQIIDKEHADTYGERQLRLFDPETRGVMSQETADGIFKVIRRKYVMWRILHPFQWFKRRRKLVKASNWNLPDSPLDQIILEIRRKNKENEVTKTTHRKPDILRSCRRIFGKLFKDR